MRRLVVHILLAFVLAVVGLLRWPAVAPLRADTCQNSGSADQGDACTNEGDAEAEVEQEGSASSGDAVGGQTVGVVSDGDASVDATNRSDDVDVSTGDASGSNSADVSARAGVFLNTSAVVFEPNLTEQEALFIISLILGGPPPPEAFADPIGFLGGLLGVESSNTCTNESSGGDVCVNRGDADATTSQSADSTSGDGIAGQVIGVVTSRRGRAELVLSNVSTDAVVETGEADFTNTSTTDSSASVFQVGGDTVFVSLPK